MDLSLLTEEEAALFETLMGKLDMQKPKRKMTPKPYTFTQRTTLKPYRLQVHYDCTTCGSKASTMFEMIPAVDGTGLVSRKCTNGLPPDKSTQRSRNLCENCRGFLFTLEKEDLVSILITVLAKV